VRKLLIVNPTIPKINDLENKMSKVKKENMAQVE
jgi:hypothetical protein